MEIKNFYLGKKVLITGHTGFKGTWLIYWLLSFGAKVYGISNSQGKLYHLYNLDKKISSNIIDIRDFNKLKKIFDHAQPDIVFHLAAQSEVLESYIDPHYTHSTNISGSLNVLEATRLCKSVKSLIYTTSDKVYKPQFNINHAENSDLLGVDPYSASKVCAELLFKSYYESFFRTQNHELGCGVVRAGNVLGGGDFSKDRIIPNILDSIFANKEIIIRSPNATRSWIDILDVLYGYLLLAKHLYKNNIHENGEPWNFGNSVNENIDVLTIVKIILEIYGKTNTCIKVETHNRNENPQIKLDSIKSQKILNWTPQISLEKTLKNCITWHKSYLNTKIHEATKKHVTGYIHQMKEKEILESIS